MKSITIERWRVDWYSADEKPYYNCEADPCGQLAFTYLSTGDRLPMHYASSLLYVPTDSSFAVWATETAWVLTPGECEEVRRFVADCMRDKGFCDA